VEYTLFWLTLLLFNACLTVTVSIYDNASYVVIELFHSIANSSI